MVEGAKMWPSRKDIAPPLLPPPPPLASPSYFHVCSELVLRKENVFKVRSKVLHIDCVLLKLVHE